VIDEADTYATLDFGLFSLEVGVQTMRVALPIAVFVDWSDPDCSWAATLAIGPLYACLVVE